MFISLNSPYVNICWIVSSYVLLTSLMLKISSFVPWSGAHWAVVHAFHNWACLIHRAQVITGGHSTSWKYVNCAALIVLLSWELNYIITSSPRHLGSPCTDRSYATREQGQVVMNLCCNLNWWQLLSWFRGLYCSYRHDWRLHFCIIFLWKWLGCWWKWGVMR